MKELAVYLMLQLGGNATPSKDDVTKALSAVGVESDSAQLDKLFADLEGKDIGELMAEGKDMLAEFGSGGGGGGAGGADGAGGDAEEAKEEEPEEEEAPPAVDMFGGGDGGDY